MKKTIDAINELRAIIPTNLLNNKGWTYHAASVGLSFNGVFVCTEAGFNKCVEELSKAEVSLKQIEGE